MDQRAINRVWLGLLESDRLARYYGRLAERFGHRHRIGMILLASFSLGAVATLFVSLREWGIWVSVAFSVPAAVIAIVLSYVDYSRKAGISASIASLCIELTQEWRQLWEGSDSNEVLSRANEFDRRLNMVTTPALQQTGFNDETLNGECEKKAYAYWPSILPPPQLGGAVILLL